jgi:exoribonuclease-2
VTDSIGTGSLVLYKTRPALVTAIGDKLEIVLDAGKTKKVRRKDIQLLHPGPCQSLTELKPMQGNVLEAWELLQGEQPDLQEIAELAYGEFSPMSAWAAWQTIDEGLYFSGNLEAIQVHSTEQLAAEQQAREAKAQEAAAWESFLNHVRNAQLNDDDRKRLAEVERVALGQSEHSPILQAFDVDVTTAAAHRFLLNCAYWLPTHNPWPGRAGLDLSELTIGLPEMPQDGRLDLTHLAAWAIDDEGNQDPDDAISLDGDYLWVHIADVAALVRPDSHLDIAARGRGSNLYLPERVYPMLPASLTQQLGMGLQDRSPALSIGFRWADNSLNDIQVVLSWVNVQRTTYNTVNQRMQEPEFAAIAQITDTYRAQRMARHAACINLPEVSVRLVGEDIQINPLPRIPSRDMVTDAMLMAGEAVALFAAQNDLAIPHAMQPEPETIQQPQSLSGMYAYRRLFKASNTVLKPAPHFGLGLARYARATSPLRRYADLLVHQQLRACVTGATPMPADTMAERIAGLDAQNARIRRTERYSNMHWKLIYLQKNTDWQGEAVVVALEERKAVVIVPSLALEIKIRRRDSFELDQAIQLKVSQIDIFSQDIYFQTL